MRYDILVLLLSLFSVMTVSAAHAEVDKLQLDECYKFALGVGAAIIMS